MKILYYDGNDPQKRERVIEVLSGFAIPYIMLENNQGNETIADLLSLTKQKNTAFSKKLPDLDIMIFHEIEDDEITKISEALHRQDAQVERKCIVTKHNQAWTLYDLMKEIIEEHAYYTILQECYALIKEVSSFQENDYTKETWNAYQVAFMRGYLLLQEVQPSKQALEEAVNEIKDSRNQLIKRLT